MRSNWEFLVRERIWALGRGREKEAHSPPSHPETQTVSLSSTKFASGTFHKRLHRTVPSRFFFGLSGCFKQRIYFCFTRRTTKGKEEKKLRRPAWRDIACAVSAHCSLFFGNDTLKKEEWWGWREVVNTLKRQTKWKADGTGKVMKTEEEAIAKKSKGKKRKFAYSWKLERAKLLLFNGVSN